MKNTIFILTILLFLACNKIDISPKTTIYGITKDHETGILKPNVTVSLYSSILFIPNSQHERASTLSDENGKYSIKLDEDIINISIKSFRAYCKDFYLDSVDFITPYIKGGKNNVDIYLRRGENILIVNSDSLYEQNFFEYRLIIEELYENHQRTDTINFEENLNKKNMIYSYKDDRLSLWICRKEINSGIEEMQYDYLYLNTNDTTNYYVKWIK